MDLNDILIMRDIIRDHPFNLTMIFFQSQIFFCVSRLSIIYFFRDNLSRHIFSGFKNILSTSDCPPPPNKTIASPPPFKLNDRSLVKAYQLVFFFRISKLNYLWRWDGGTGMSNWYTSNWKCKLWSIWLEHVFTPINIHSRLPCILLFKCRHRQMWRWKSV